MTEKTNTLTLQGAPAAKPANTGGKTNVRIIGTAPQVYTTDEGDVIVRLYTDKELPWDARNWTYDQRAEIVKAMVAAGKVGSIWTTGSWRYDTPGVPYMLYAQTKRHPMLVAVSLDDLRGSLGEDRS